MFPFRFYLPLGNDIIHHINLDSLHHTMLWVLLFFFQMDISFLLFGHFLPLESSVFLYTFFQVTEGCIWSKFKMYNMAGLWLWRRRFLKFWWKTGNFTSLQTDWKDAETDMHISVKTPRWEYIYAVSSVETFNPPLKHSSWILENDCVQITHILLASKHLFFWCTGITLTFFFCILLQRQAILAL